MNYALLVLALAAPVPVKEKIAPPQGPPPQYATAVMRDGKLQLRQSVMVPIYREETRVKTTLVNGKPVAVFYKVAKVEYRSVQRMRQVDKPRFFNTAGKEIEARRLANRLTKETVVLVSTTGKPLDPYYLRTVKEGTLILALPFQDLPGGPVRESPRPRDDKPLPPPKRIPLDKKP